MRFVLLRVPPPLRFTVNWNEKEMRSVSSTKLLQRALFGAINEPWSPSFAQPELTGYFTMKSMKSMKG
jgi:hypothetical protein